MQILYEVMGHKWLVIPYTFKWKKLWQLKPRYLGVLELMSEETVEFLSPRFLRKPVSVMASLQQ